MNRDVTGLLPTVGQTITSEEQGHDWVKKNKNILCIHGKSFVKRTYLCLKFKYFT